MSDEQGDAPSSPDIHFEPVMTLPLVDVKTMEENEETLFQMRAKLYRYESAGDPPEWKERGTGEVKILKHKTEDHVRILMRRDKTLKICANHYIQPYMELKPNSSSDRAWIWSVLADFADEEPKSELLAIKFANAENAQKFKEAFNEAKDISTRFLKKQKKNEDDEENESEDGSSDSEENSDVDNSLVKSTPTKESEEVADKLSNLTVEEKNRTSPTKEENKESEK
ncbi:ran-specific GTPase-activating protein [Caerostris extrusa]|uniref:Ran-specific GTPase-activating protein n=1 Tax=Caerostris extrusa TaxID=172846 RepID=A0AAV4PGU3_CAEEX|nr:ran-specific GTPase-activating protein [Caerostris extrusa]